MSFAARPSGGPGYGDRYGADVLAGDRQRRGMSGAAHGAAQGAAEVPAELGVVVEEAETGWCGAVVRVEKAGGMHVVHLEDRRGRIRAFPLGPGFVLDGAPVVLTAATRAASATLAAARQAGARTASGSRAVPSVGRHTAKVASASRIFVEGRHDAELVEKVWGADLRVEGVVVELLEGVDDLAAAIEAFGPGPRRRMGALVDHLVPGTKEARLVAAARALPAAGGDVLVVGHPYVDVWQAVRPGRLGLAAWPTVPRGQSWKHGVCAALGWPHQTQADIAVAWRRILRTVRTYADLEPALLGRVEELIDFVTVGGSGSPLSLP